MRSHLRLRALLLLLVASALASQPWHRATAVIVPAATDPLAADLQLAICSFHGLLRLGADGTPTQDQEAPACPWCALEAGPGLHLTAVVAVPIDILTPPRTLYAALAALAPSPVPPLTAWAAPPPRAPPGPLRA
jgi:hypothetical protein